MTTCWRSLCTRAALFIATVTIAALSASPARAAGSSMPWEAPLQKILESIEGPVAKIIAVIIIIVTGLTLATGEPSGVYRLLIELVFGLSCAVAAARCASQPA